MSEFFGTCLAVAGILLAGLCGLVLLLVCNPLFWCAVIVAIIVSAF